jgi:sec-independent protein translocase protein TatB
MFPEGRLLDFMIVGAVALIVVGPKDLPLLMRKVGQFMARMRGMAAEFRASFDELARQSELDALRKEVEALRIARPMDFAIDAAKDAGVHEALSEVHTAVSGVGADLGSTLGGPAAQPTAPEALPAEPSPEPKAPLP